MPGPVVLVPGGNVLFRSRSGDASRFRRTLRSGRVSVLALLLKGCPSVNPRSLFSVGNF